MPEIYRAAMVGLGPPSSSRVANIQNWQDDLPRRKVVRQLKETLLKSTILVGELSTSPCKLFAGSNSLCQASGTA